MAIDIHVHPNFFEDIQDEERSFEFLQNSKEIFNNSTSSISHIRNQMKCAKLNKLVLLGQDERSIYGMPVVCNDDIAKLVTMYPEDFYGFASIDPSYPGALDELKRSIIDLRLHGLKLDLAKLGMYPNDLRVHAIYEFCEEKSIPILFHSGMSWQRQTEMHYGHPMNFEWVAIHYPELRFCLGHFGFPWVKETACLLIKHKNVYADTAALYFDSACEFYDYLFKSEIPLTWLDRSLWKKVIFGSNQPRFEQIRMANALRNLPLHPNTIERIMHINALEFLGVIK